MTYTTEVLADSPWGFWLQTETAGTALDDAGTLNNDLTITGSAHTLNQTGPAAGYPAIVWTQGVAGKAASSNQLDFASVTLECWVQLTAAPSANTNLVSIANLT